MRRWSLLALVACGASTPPTNVTHTFAFHDFYLGDMARDQTYASYDAWKT